MISDFIEGFVGGLRGIALAVVSLLVIAGVVGVTVAYYQADHIHEACMVQEKESVSKDGGHTYRVYTDCGNFVVEDEFWARNFHASETYADLQPDHAYDIRTHGWRVPFLSVFPNVYAATPTGETAR